MKHRNLHLTVLTWRSLALILTRDGLEGSLSEGGRDVSLGLAPAQLALQRPEGLREGPTTSSRRTGAQLQVEGGEDGVDDGPLDAEGHGDDPHHDHEELQQQGGEQLGQDDGGKHHDKQGDEVSDRAEVEPEVILGRVVGLVVVVVSLGGGVAVLRGAVARVWTGVGGRGPGGGAVAGLLRLTPGDLVLDRGYNQDQEGGGGQHLQSVAH